MLFYIITILFVFHNIGVCLLCCFVMFKRYNVIIYVTILCRILLYCCFVCDIFYYNLVITQNNTTKHRTAKNNTSKSKYHNTILNETTENDRRQRKPTQQNKTEHNRTQ